MAKNELPMAWWFNWKEFFIQGTKLIPIVLRDDLTRHHITHFILSHNSNRKPLYFINKKQ